MNTDESDARDRRVAAYFTILERSDTTVYSAIEALSVLTDKDIQWLGNTRAALAAELLERFSETPG